MIHNTIYKIKNTHSKMHRWCSLKPNTPFVPILDVPVWVDELDDTLISKVLSTVKLKEHKEKLYDNDQWQHYNVFQWQYPEISVLKAEIKRTHAEFLQALGLPPRDDLWINGWVYPQKRGMSLKMHNHAIHENAYLSANIILTNNNTTTDFDIPFISVNEGPFELENKLGRISIFPSHLPHSVKCLEDHERYTIGIDLITDLGMSTYRNHSNDPTNPLFRAVKL